ncbi:hypothetical protein [Burkholderia sp. JKS000303]|uniref:hypothetical protein n=1 Tax=Burkholderia sp. JKS000303 TaxID=1938747 RepID=UPI00117D237C|nr:hypothetical protein [Burkholderia sp. JKS000303]
MAIKAGVSGLLLSAVDRRAVGGAAAGHYPEERVGENRRTLLVRGGIEKGKSRRAWHAAGFFLSSACACA